MKAFFSKQGPESPSTEVKSLSSLNVSSYYFFSFFSHYVISPLTPNDFGTLDDHQTKHSQREGREN